jgi:YD repeat-containing protein
LIAVVCAGVNGLPARNIRTEYYYDAALNLTKVVNDAGVNRKNATTLMSYRLLGSEPEYGLTQMVDAIGRTTRFEYNGLGELVKSTLVGARTGANSALITCNGSEARSNTGDRITRYCYTPEGWLAKVILDDGRVAMEQSYGRGDGLPTSSKDARGVVRTLEYDLAGRLIKAKNGTVALIENSINYPAINSEYSIAYNSNDQITAVVAKLASGTRNLVLNQYDGFARLSQSQDGAGNQTRYLYHNLNNNLITVIAGFNSSQAVRNDYQYDRLGRLLSSTLDQSGKNLITAYSYATTGDRWQLNAVTDPRGNKTSYLYNSLGSLQRTQDAQSQQGRRAGRGCRYRLCDEPCRSNAVFDAQWPKRKLEL